MCNETLTRLNMVSETLCCHILLLLTFYNLAALQLFEVSQPKFGGHVCLFSLMSLQWTSISTLDMEICLLLFLEFKVTYRCQLPVEAL